jgi:hypothetical protein
MAKIEVKTVQANMKDELEPHWKVVVSYGAHDVTIPLPARDLIGDDPDTRKRESIEALENLANALLDFATQARRRWLHEY